MLAGEQGDQEKLGTTPALRRALGAGPLPASACVPNVPLTTVASAWSLLLPSVHKLHRVRLTPSGTVHKEGQCESAGRQRKTGFLSLLKAPRVTPAPMLRETLLSGK